jgi:hypothetical protein
VAAEALKQWASTLPFSLGPLRTTLPAVEPDAESS